MNLSAVADLSDMIDLSCVVDLSGVVDLSAVHLSAILSAVVELSAIADLSFIVADLPAFVANLPDFLLPICLLLSICECSGQTSASSVSGFMMALANTYGLLFIILLLGHGLIQVPRQLWETSFNEKELARLYFIATQVNYATCCEPKIPRKFLSPE